MHTRRLRTRRLRLRVRMLWLRPRLRRLNRLRPWCGLMRLLVWLLVWLLRLLVRLRKRFDPCRCRLGARLRCTRARRRSPFTLRGFLRPRHSPALVLRLATIQCRAMLCRDTGGRRRRCSM